MSLPKSMTMECSECGEQLDITVFQSINTDYSSDIVDQIISGKLFNVQCPKCGHTSSIEYDVLYHDIKHRAMIWVLHKYDNNVNELRKSKNLLEYKTTRIVNNMNALREKALCLEYGRDDRVIELCKVFAVYNLLSKQPDFEFNNAFYGLFCKAERIFIYDKSGNELSCELTEEMYSLVADMYCKSDLYKDFDDYYAIVDAAWAEEVMETLAKDEMEIENDITPESSFAPNPKTDSNNSNIISCPNCKRQLPKDSIFCHYCGVNIKAHNSQIENSTKQNLNDNAYTSIVDGKSSPKGILLCVIGALLALVITLIFFINGSNENSLWMSDSRFQYYEEESNYVLLFELLGEENDVISADNDYPTSGNVDIRIVNDNELVVYEETISYTKEDFEYWLDDNGVERYYVSIYIDPNEILSGETSIGTVYFTVYGDRFSFDETSLYVINLPYSSKDTYQSSSSGNTQQESSSSSYDAPIQQEATNFYTCINYDCDNKTSSSGAYCSEHKCANSGCSYSKGDNSNYCLSCTCSTIGCTNAKSSSSFYCKEHACAVSGCSFEKDFGKDFCYYHACSNCNNLAVDGSSYCQEHM